MDERKGAGRLPNPLQGPAAEPPPPSTQPMVAWHRWLASPTCQQRLGGDSIRRLAIGLWLKEAAGPAASAEGPRLTLDDCAAEPRGATDRREVEGKAGSAFASSGRTSLEEREPPGTSSPEGEKGGRRRRRWKCGLLALDGRDVGSSSCSSLSSCC